MKNLIACALILAATGLAMADVQITQPLDRTAYQTNEQIHLAVTRSSDEALDAGFLTLNLVGADASTMTFTFDVPAVPAADGTAISTEHIYLNGWLMRPGKYALTAEVDGQTAQTQIEVYNHIRHSSFTLMPWSRAKGEQKLAEGEQSLGYNLSYGMYTDNEEGNFIRAGMDYMKCCTLGGGHQMNFRGNNCWSDSYVLQGSLARASRQAFINRRQPNSIGVHFFDEPGLAWQKDPVTGKVSAHTVESQWRSYRAAFGEDPIHFSKVDPDNPEDVARWKHWARWKLSFMDAAWKLCKYGVDQVEPDFLSTTQSQYGAFAFTDGYYFNVTRSLDVASGHGGYDNWGPGYWHPSLTLEVARARDLQRPCWYLPLWYGNTTSEHARLEQYLSFQTNIQGLQTPPDLDPFYPETKAATKGIVESNKLMARLGPIFNTMPVNRPPVAMLFSISDLIGRQAHDTDYMYAWGYGQHIYMAGKLLQQQFLPVLDEDILDGTLAANHKAIVLEGVQYLDQKVVDKLEDFAKNGKLVLMTDCNVQIDGAVDLGVDTELPEAEKREALAEKLKAAQTEDERKAIQEELAPLTQMRAHLKIAQRIADAIKPHLEKAKIEPPLKSSEPGISVTRQAAGDVEYIFAVNATHDFQASPQLGLKAATATLALPVQGGPVYDAIVGGPMAGLEKKGNQLVGKYRFGPGQMRVFARTAQPIKNVTALTPVIKRDYNLKKAPLSIEFGAVVVDANGNALSGSIPLHIQLIDPLGVARYDLYRATRMGTFRMAVPLAANDPEGDWTLTVTELLANTTSSKQFTLSNPDRCGDLAGLKKRAIFFGRDWDHIWRFFRKYEDVTIVKGNGDYDAEAQRLVEILDPWDVRAKVVDAAEVNKPRPVSAEEAKHWVGLWESPVKPNDQRISLVGFDIQGPVILLGTPEDNPLIKAVQQYKFLPYTPDAKTMPGPGRGYIAWQRDAVGFNQESITLIGYDKKGMSEAIGTMYEALAGLEPLLPYVLPKDTAIAPAEGADVPTQPTKAWQKLLPDSAVAMASTDGAVSILTWDQSITTLNPQGSVVDQKTLGDDEYEARKEALQAANDPAALEAAKKVDDTSRIVKFAFKHGNLNAVGYWGGGLRLIDDEGRVLFMQQYQADITGLASVGETLVVGLSDARILGLQIK